MTWMPFIVMDRTLILLGYMVPVVALLSICPPAVMFQIPGLVRMRWKQMVLGWRWLVCASIWIGASGVKSAMVAGRFWFGVIMVPCSSLGCKVDSTNSIPYVIIGVVGVSQGFEDQN